jgi:hypothetical protein
MAASTTGGAHGHSHHPDHFDFEKLYESEGGNSNSAQLSMTQLVTLWPNRDGKTFSSFISPRSGHMIEE